MTRYTCKLLLSVGAVDKTRDSRLYQSLDSIEKSLGTSRKAYRIGKFLEHVSALQKKNPYLVPSISSSILELLVNVGEGVYYFIDQFQFFVKIGVLNARQGETLTKVSATAELVGYAANTVLNVLRLHNLLEREIALISELKRRKNKSEAGGSVFDPSEDTNKVLLSEIHSLRRRRTLRTLCLAQDAADAFLAIHDLRDVCGRPSGGGMRKSVLAAAGVVSGCIGMYKKF